MKLIKNSFLLLFSFVLLVSSIFVTDIKSDTAQAKSNDEWESTAGLSIPSSEEDSINGEWESTVELSIPSSETINKLNKINEASSSANVVMKYGVRYDKKKKKWIGYHKIAYISGSPSSVKTTLKINKRPSENSKVSQYSKKSHTFKHFWNLRAGEKYEYEIPKSTGFYKRYFTIEMTSGGRKGIRVIPDMKYTLFNKKLAKFPDYTDKWSKKVASNIRTDWPKGQKYNRASTVKIRKEYEKKYKVKPKWDKDRIELHHIRPVAQGGNSKLENYMAIPKAEHAKISKWFLSY